MFNPKDHIYDGYIRPYCMGQSGGSRRCPVCGEYTNNMLPITWYESNKSYMAFFCKEHKPGDLGWIKVYKYEEWDIKEGTEHGSFDKRVYVDLSGSPITGILEGFYGYTANTGDKINCQYVKKGKRIIKGEFHGT